MAEFLKIARSLLISPLFFAYWLAKASEALGNHYNQGSSGSFALGASVLTLMFAGTVIFYVQLGKMQTAAGSSNRRSLVKFIINIIAYRLMLLLFFAPLAYWIYSQGVFGRIFSTHFGVVVSSTDDFFNQFYQLASASWPFLLLLVVYVFFDLAGKSYLVGGGRLGKVFPQIILIIPRIALSLGAITAAVMILIFFQFFDVIFAFSPELLPAWIGTALLIATAPAFFLVEIAGITLMAKKMSQGLP